MLSTLVQSAAAAADKAAVTFPILSALILVPLLGAVIVTLLSNRRPEYVKLAALIISVGTGAMSLWMLAKFQTEDAGFQFVSQHEWIRAWGISWHLGVDGISLFLVVLTGILFPLVIVGVDPHHDEKRYLGWLLLLEAGVMGSFLSLDLFLFFIFFEIVLVPMYFLIGGWGYDKRIYAATKFFLYTMFGSALMLVAFLALFFTTGAESFSIPYLIENGGEIAKNTQIWIFAGMFVGFAVKVPMFPFHTWLPDAHTQAPTQGSVILAAILLKLGTYGFVRIAIPILPDAALEWAPWIGLLAVIGIIYGALGCLAQTDMKRLIAFSSVAHMGYVMLGISTLTSFGMNAAMFGMVAHGLITGMLFFVAGSVKERYHTLEIKRLSGMLVQMPKLGWILGFCAMASLGLPGLAGFWGEFPAILSAYQPAEGLNVNVFRVYMVVAAIGTVLAAGYLLWLYQRTAFGEPTAEFAAGHGHDEDIHDVNKFEWIAWTPLLFAIVVFGVYPQLMFKVLDPAVGVTLKAFGG